MEHFSEQQRYEHLQLRQQQEWESTCRRCGACCGAADGDPCEHLVMLTQGGYACSIYENRFGTRKTVEGRVFQCVPIRDILFESWSGDRCCGYKKQS